MDATTNDVDVWLNGVYAGKTPVTQKVKRNRDLEILGKKEGYESYNKAVMSNMNATGKLDAIGLLFLLIPGVGLLTPGAYSLDDQVVIMDLRMAPQ